MHPGITITLSPVDRGESPPGRSLRVPYLNDRAMEYWDVDALDRWAARHEFETPEMP